MVARGLVFAMAGLFLVMAAIDANPQEARGLAGTLSALQGQPYGWVVLGITALGLFAFGLYELVVAYYRRIDTSEVDSAARELKSKAS